MAQFSIEHAMNVNRVSGGVRVYLYCFSALDRVDG
jgi:hypothetical protein